MQLFDEKQQEQVKQEAQEVRSEVVHQEEPDWVIDERMREEIARAVEEKLALAKKVVETERALELIRSPKETIALAKEAADQLYEIIKRRSDWVVMIEGKEFLTFPAWQLLGSFFGLMPVVTEIREIRDEAGRCIGFHAVAVVRNRFGDEITRAEARADRLEVIPEYEYITLPDGRRKRGKFLGYKQRFGQDKSDQVVMATAQTRAMRRALQQVLNFVVGLAGYETVPAEEVTEEEAVASAEELVAPEDWAKFWAQVKRMGYKPDQVHAMFGVKSLTEIVRTKAELQKVLEVLEKERKKEG